jgi:iron(III) transport system substrate-binding protein
MTLPASPRRLNRRILALTLFAVTAAACGSADTPSAPADAPAGAPAPTGGDATETVTVYTGRHYGIEPIFASFTEATGIEVRFTTGSDPELRERLLAEGANTPADVVMTADAANIALASAAGLLAPLDSQVLQDAIPAELRAEDGTWFALSRRLRVIQYSVDRITAPPTTYAEVGDPRFAGRLCLRPSTHPYTQSLVAALIRNEGPEEAERIVASWVANDPIYINSDTDLLRAVAAGDCDVALANSYYLGRLKVTEDPAFPVAISWPDQGGFGAHVNISAAAVTAAAPNPAGALTLLEWLATVGQKEFSDANHEYPAAVGVEPAEVLIGFGTFVSDDDSVRELGRLNAAAVDLLAVVGYE